MKVSWSKYILMVLFPVLVVGQAIDEVQDEGMGPFFGYEEVKDSKWEKLPDFDADFPNLVESLGKSDNSAENLAEDENSDLDEEGFSQEVDEEEERALLAREEQDEDLRISFTPYEDEVDQNEQREYEPEVVEVQKPDLSEEEVYALPNHEFAAMRYTEKEVEKEEETSFEVLLALAIEDRDHASVRKLIKWGVNVNHYFTEGQGSEVKVGNTFLLSALKKAKRRSLRTVKLLLEAGADVNAEDPETGDTPMHIAVQIGNRVALGLLLQNKARWDIRNNKGESPRMLAQKNFEQEMIVMIDKVEQIQKKEFYAGQIEAEQREVASQEDQVGMEKTQNEDGSTTLSY